jgi:hypothetical protein
VRCRAAGLGAAAGVMGRSLYGLCYPNKIITTSEKLRWTVTREG